MLAKDFLKATDEQLRQILNGENDCPLIYKCFAEYEIERRAKEGAINQ